MLCVICFREFRVCLACQVLVENRDLRCAFTLLYFASIGNQKSKFNSMCINAHKLTSLLSNYLLLIVSAFLKKGPKLESILNSLCAFWLGFC